MVKTFLSECWSSMDFMHFSKAIAIFSLNSTLKHTISPRNIPQSDRIAIDSTRRHINCDPLGLTWFQVQGASSALYSTSKETGHVDLFISHPWEAGRWSKFLALCLPLDALQLFPFCPFQGRILLEIQNCLTNWRFFNLELALKCCLAMWFAIVSILLAAFGWSGLGANQFLFPGLVCLPMATFFVVFFFGQELSAGRWSPTLWVDKICVHQTDLELKAEQIASLPIFVAHSSSMLILWDETYFESWMMASSWA